jgi:membrane protein
MPDLLTRAETWATARETRFLGVNPALLALSVLRRFNAVRATGLAAEMTYYALVSLVPFILALGAAVGYLEAIIGQEQVAAVEEAIILGLRSIFAPEVTAQFVEPLVRGLLAEERTGTAVLSLFATFLLASAVFRAVIRALDDAYAVPERRGFLHVWGLAYLFALTSVVVIALGIALVVVGPLLGGGQIIAGWLGLGRVFEVVWAVGRWPALLAVGTAYLAWLYSKGPNVRAGWRHSLPGALVATVGGVLIAVGLRFYLQIAGPRSPAVGDAADALQTISQTLGSILAVMLWIWLTSTAILLGGILNAEANRQRGDMPPVDV